MQKRSALFKISILIGATFWLWLTALNAEANSSSKKIWNTLEDIPQSAKTASDSIPKTSKAPVDRVPVSPEASDEIDKQMKAVLMRWQIPGAQLAIARNGEIIFSRGYGCADLKSQKPVEPQSLFRIASLSKCITAAAVMKLVEDGKLKLSDRVFQGLPDLFARQNAKGKWDPRVAEISVSDLLNMSAGWDRNKRGEALFMPNLKKIASRYDTLCPPDLQTVCRYELSKKLEYDPGTHFSYSNLSYAILGELVGTMSGQSYKDFCQNALFAPASIKTILPAARTAKQKQAQEVSYYPEKRGKLVKSIFSQDLEERLPAPYCQIDIERYIASFGWLSNAEEFLRFQYAVFGSAAYTNGRIDSTNNKLLSQASLAQMLARPALPDYQKSTGYVAAGYFLSSDYARGKASLFKDGTLSGSRSFFICFPDGTSCCALFNARPPYHKTDALQKEIRFLFDSISKSASAAGSPN